MAKYSERLVGRIVALIEEDVYTTTEICAMLRVSRAVFYKWKKEKPEFAQQIEAAEDARYEKLVQLARKSLNKKLEGYTSVETRTVYTVVEEDGEEPTLKMKQYEVREKHHAPDMRSIAYVLGTKEKKSKAEWKGVGDGMSPLIIEVSNPKTKEQLEILRNKLQKRDG